MILELKLPSCDNNYFFLFPWKIFSDNFLLNLNLKLSLKFELFKNQELTLFRFVFTVKLRISYRLMHNFGAAWRIEKLRDWKLVNISKHQKTSERLTIDHAHSTQQHPFSLLKDGQMGHHVWETEIDLRMAIYRNLFPTKTSCVSHYEFQTNHLSMTSKSWFRKSPIEQTTISTMASL